MLGLIASAPALEMAMVYPSGGDFATASVPVTPPCPERLSMTIGCLRISDMRCPTTRAMMSFGPPGGNGTISLIDLLGKSCAIANAGHSKANPISNGLKAFTVILPVHDRAARCGARGKPVGSLTFSLRHCKAQALAGSNWAPAPHAHPRASGRGALMRYYAGEVGCGARA